MDVYIFIVHCLIPLYPWLYKCVPHTIFVTLSVSDFGNHLATISLTGVNTRQLANNFYRLFRHVKIVYQFKTWHGDFWSSLLRF